MSLEVFEAMNSVGQYLRSREYQFQQPAQVQQEMSTIQATMPSMSMGGGTAMNPASSLSRLYPQLSYSMSGVQVGTAVSLRDRPQIPRKTACQFLADSLQPVQDPERIECDSLPTYTPYIRQITEEVLATKSEMHDLSPKSPIQDNPRASVASIDDLAPLHRSIPGRVRTSSHEVGRDLESRRVSWDSTSIPMQSLDVEFYHRSQLDMRKPQSHENRMPGSTVSLCAQLLSSTVNKYHPTRAITMPAPPGDFSYTSLPVPPGECSQKQA